MFCAALHFVPRRSRSIQWPKGNKHLFRTLARSDFDACGKRLLIRLALEDIHGLTRTLPLVDDGARRRHQAHRVLVLECISAH